MDPLLALQLYQMVNPTGITNAVDSFSEGKVGKGALNLIPIANQIVEAQDEKKAMKDLEIKNFQSSVASSDALNKREFKTGGLILGEGTGKSDSIKTKLPAGTFVVPSENADKAMQLGMGMFNWKEGQTATGKANKGVDVSVSNGEVLFSPEEVAMMNKNGIDYTSLAPNADNSKFFKKGGFMKKGLKELECADGGMIPDMDAVMKLADGGYVYDEKTDRMVSTTDKGKKLSVDREGRVYEQLQDGTWKDVSGEDKGSNIYSNQRAGLAREYAKDFAKADEMRKRTVSSTAKDIAKSSEQGYDPILDNKDGLDFITENEKKLAQNYAGPENASQMTASDRKGVRDAKSFTGSELAEINAVPSSEFDLSDITGGKKNPEEGINDETKLDPMTLMGAGQTALGLTQSLLNKDKEPPRYNKSGELRSAYTRALKEAEFGLDTSEKAELNKSIEGNRFASAKNIREASGGSGSTALSNELAVALNANKAKLGVEQYDKQLKQQKQQYANTFIAPIMTENQFQYTEDMRKYERDANAYADLLNAGIGNVVGAYKFRKQLDAEKEIGKIGGTLFG